MSLPQQAALLLDEMFSPDIAEELRRRGHDVIAVAADLRLRAMTDSELFALAVEQGRRCSRAAGRSHAADEARDLSSPHSSIG